MKAAYRLLENIRMRISGSVLEANDRHNRFRMSIFGLGENLSAADYLSRIVVGRSVVRRSCLGVADEAKTSQHFLGANDRGCDLSHRQPFLRVLLADQLIRFRLPDLLQRDQNLDGLVDIPSGLERFLELLELALEPPGVTVHGACENQR